VAKQFDPRDVGGTGRQQTAPQSGWAQYGFVHGDRLSFNCELAATGGVDEVIFAQPVRSVIVWSAADCFIATTAAAIAGPGTGNSPDSRFLVKANERRELPLYQDEVFVKGAGLVTLEGRW
jgi:hypothetical protein